MVKKVFVLVLVIFVGLIFACTAFAQEKIKVGILKYSDAAHYVETVNGILAKLKEEGFDETKVIFDIRSADGSKDKATEIAKEFRAKGMNVIMPIGTGALVSTHKEVKDIPIVFANIFNPIALAGVAKSWESSGTNATGASNWVEMSAIVNTIKQVSPRSKRIGAFSVEEEPNTLIQVEDLKKLQDKMGIEVVDAKLTKSEEAGEVSRSLVGRVDAIYIGGGSLIDKGLKAILGVTTNAKLITVSHLEEKVKDGVLLAVSANSFKVGELGGKKAAQVLRGAKPSDIPIECLKTYDISVNLKTADTIGVKIPAGLLKIATKVIKE